MTRPRRSVIGNITRSRKRSNGTRNVVAGNQQPGLHHVLDRNAVAAQMLLEREALVGRIAEAELQLRRRIEAAVGEIAARLGAGA